MTADANATSALTNAPSASVLKSLVTTLGDIIVATGNAAVARLGIGATGQVPTVAGGTLAYAYPVGYEYAYAEKASATTTTQTTPANSTDTIATCAAVTFDGSTVVAIEMFVPEVFNSVATNFNTLLLFEDGSLKAQVARVQNAGTTQGTSAFAKYRFTPASGSRTYSLRCAVGGGTGTFSAGAAGAGFPPAFIRVVKV